MLPQDLADTRLRVTGVPGTIAINDWDFIYGENRVTQRWSPAVGARGFSRGRARMERCLTCAMRPIAAV